MKNVQLKSSDYLKEIDRMINEGLGNGIIVPKYDEAHLQLKEKEESLVLKSEENRGEKNERLLPHRLWLYGLIART